MTVAAYYDTWADKLVEDFKIRNRRVVEALAFAKDSLGDTRTVLDVGCGIGWTTSELADTGRSVTGLDVSPVLIETASAMFPACEFEVGDFSTHSVGRFDAVLMVDVYEHFPRDTWPQVHAQIWRTGARRIILTVPTVQTQDYARVNGIPLQIVDEDVTDADLGTLAADIGGVLTVNRPVSVWRPNDYRHVLVEVD